MITFDERTPDLVQLIPYASLVVDEGGRVVVCDISRRKQVEEKLVRSQKQLREFTARLLTLRETERARMSSVIHDEIGQMLSGLKMDLVWLQKRLNRREKPLLQQIDGMVALIDTAVQEVRRISTELRPGVLDDLGLGAAVLLFPMAHFGFCQE